MLNWIALAFEVIGFSLAYLETFHPVQADRLERDIDRVVGLNVRPIAIGVAVYIFSGFVILFLLEYVGWWAFIVGFLVLSILFTVNDQIRYKYEEMEHAISPVALVFLCLYIPIAIFIVISNKIHPADRALGGAGLIIAGIGLFIDFIQVL